VGLLGTGLLLSWIFTDHYFLGANENAFQANPVSLVLAALILYTLTGRRTAWTGRTAAAVAALALAGLTLQLLPGLDQVNGEILAVAVPAHLGLAWAVREAWPASTG
jgi:hypothetical protein